MGIENSTDTPWSRRASFPTAPFYITVLNAILTVALSVVAPLGTIVTMGIASLAAAVFFSVNILSCRSPFIYAVIPLSYGITVALTHDVLGSLISLVYIPMTAVIAVMFFGRASRFELVAALSAVSATVTVAIVAILFAIEFGSVSAGLDAYKATLEASASSIIEALAENGVSTSQLTDARFVSTIVNTTVSLIPGMVMMAAEICSLVAVALIWKYLGKLKIAPALRDGEWKTEAPKPVGVIFAAALIASGVLSLIGTAEMLSFAATNLLLIVIPPVFIEGVRSYASKLPRMSKGFKLGIIAVLVLSALYLPFILILVVLVLSVAGMFAVIKRGAKTDNSNPNER